MELGKDTKLTLKLETIISVVLTIGMIVGVYFSLLGEIAIAKELPTPEVSRTEYDLKDQAIRTSILSTEKKVEENSLKLDKIDEKLYEIIMKK